MRRRVAAGVLGLLVTAAASATTYSQSHDGAHASAPKATATSTDIGETTTNMTRPLVTEAAKSGEILRAAEAEQARADHERAQANATVNH